MSSIFTFLVVGAFVALLCIAFVLIGVWIGSGGIFGDGSEEENLN